MVIENYLKIDAHSRLNKELAAGKSISELEIKDKLRKVIKFQSEFDKTTALLDLDNLQEACDEKGFFSVASSCQLEAHELYRIYKMRDSVETQFGIKQSQIGHDTLRAHSDPSIQARVACSFLACTIRAMLALETKGLQTPINKVIKGLANINLMSAGSDDMYELTHTASKKYFKLLNDIGVSIDSLEGIAYEVNLLKENPNYSQVREIPNFFGEKPKKKRGRPPKQKPETTDEEPKVARKPGRPKGSKNKTTLMREAAAALLPPPPPAKLGRPLGRKNNSTLEREKALQDAMQPRKPGRPKGSKNKKTLEQEALIAMHMIKRGPGRPKGSKNKRTIELEQAMIAAQKRRPGRPKGSTTKVRYE